MNTIEDKTTLDAIHRLELELAETRQKIRKLKDDLKDIAEQNDEWRALREEVKDLVSKRATAKKLLEADRDYQVVNSELEELKFKFKDLEEIMSHHLVSYYGETNSTEVETIDGETQQITIKAKLGR